MSAVGQSILNFVFGGPELIDGTSASAPIFAAILTRINEERLKAGKSTVGFVNPVLVGHMLCIFFIEDRAANGAT